MRTLNELSVVFFLVDKYSENPVTDAKIVCKNSQVICYNKRNGYYVFLNLESGLYDFDIIHKDYKVVSKSINVVADKPQKITVKME